MELKEVIIRDAELADLPIIAEAANKFINEASIDKLFDYNSKSFLRFLQYCLYRESCILLIAEHMELSVGALLMECVPSMFNENQIIGEILFIDVLPEYRKMKIALKLLARAEEWAKQNNIHVLSLNLPQTEIVKNMEKYGFNVIEKRLMKKIEV